ncbi:MAG: hypothetical protein ACP5D7_03095 [Limnospira sp.]
MPLSPDIPQYAQDLMDFYSPPRQDARGVGIFYEQIQPEADLEKMARHHYQYFVGEQWDRHSDAWMRPWKLIYQRARDIDPCFVAEITAAATLAGEKHQNLFSKFLNINPDDYVQAYTVLQTAFDSPEVEDFRVYTIGDGEVVEGLLAISHRRNGETVIFAFLDKKNSTHGL